MKSKVLLFIFVFAGFCFSQAVIAAEPVSAAKKPAEPVQKPSSVIKGSYAAPDFGLQDIHQDEVRLSDYKNDKPVMLFFWTTWCPFCQQELSVLKNMNPDLVKEGVELLSIDVGELSDKVNDTVNSLRLPFRVLLDTDTTVSLKYKIVGVPTYVLVNKEGTVVYQDNSFPSDYKELIK